MSRQARKEGKNKDLSTCNRPKRPTKVGFAFSFVLAIWTHLKNYVRLTYDFQRISGASVIKLNTLLTIVLHDLKSCKRIIISIKKRIWKDFDNPLLLSSSNQPWKTTLLFVQMIFCKYIVASALYSANLSSLLSFTRDISYFFVQIEILQIC